MIKISTPEAQGIPSAALSQLLKRLKQHNIPLHSLLIARHGYLILETYSEPYGRDVLHRMFSETKSLTSLAIGLLVSDGTIRLEDRICDYFPEYLPEKVHPWLQEMTIHHMLTMETCHEGTTYDKRSSTEHWVRSFFQTVPTHQPGTMFLYDTSSAHTLAALVEKLTGEKVLDFLKRRVLREIGFSEESYIIEDPFGTSMGGSGLMAKPIDLLKLGWLLMNHGVYQGCQLYPKEYLDKALAFQVSTTTHSLSDRGYGYQFWQVPGHGFGMLGMGSQDTRCYPNEDIVVVVTADTQGMPNGSDIIFQDIFEEVFEQMQDEPLPENRTAYHVLQQQIARQELPVLTDAVKENCQKKISGVEYVLLPNRQGFQKISLEMEETQGTFIYETATGSHRIVFGRAKNLFGSFPEYEQRYAASAAWCEACTLYLRIYLLDESLASVHVRLHFSEEGNLTVAMQKTEESKFDEFQGILNGRQITKERENV